MKTATYRTTDGREFTRFSTAMRHAQEIRCEVFEIETGHRRWTPGTVSSAAQRRYNERLAAWNAQQAAK